MIRTHHVIDPTLSGRPETVADGRAVVVLETGAAMAADDRGLVHGGFVFSLADHAAMLAINHPNVVLGSAEVRFERPVRLGERLVAEAVAAPAEGKKLPVDVVVRRHGGGERAGEVVMRGRFICFAPERHVLEG